MVEYKSCLVITRHRLLDAQDKDIDSICDEVSWTPELPTDPAELLKLIKPHDAVIGTIPMYLQVPIVQSGKALIVFVMRSIGVLESKEDAESVASRYQGRATILPPSKEGEKYRVVLYEGLKLIKEIKVVDEWIVQHTS